MDLKKLEFLLKVEETRSITEAAKQLFITQPALSQVISSLEKKYDIKIFERKEGGLSITQEGKLLIDTARREVIMEANLRQELDDMKNEKSGVLRVGLSVNRAAMFLPVILPEWRKMYPKVQLRVNTRSGNGFEKQVAEGKLDFAFVMDAAEVAPSVRKELVYEPLFVYRLLLAVPPNHPLAKTTGGIFDWRLRPPVDLNLVKDDPFITNNHEPRFARWLNAVYEAYDFYPNSAVVINGSSQFNLVQSGIGCALLQDTIAFAQKRGVFFRLDKGDFATTLCMIRRKDSYVSQSMNAFMELVRENIRLGTWDKI